MYLEKVTCLNHQRRYINDTNQCVDFNHLEHKKVYQIYAGNCFIHHDLLDFIYSPYRSCNLRLQNVFKNAKVKQVSNNVNII